MGWRLTLWAGLLGFAGGYFGIYAGDAVRPDLHTAPGWGLVLGALLGATLGCVLVWLTHERRPGD
jgi:hypothetical protein